MGTAMWLCPAQRRWNRTGRSQSSKARIGRSTRYVDVASVVMPMMAGADFVMYGPMEYSRRAFHAAGFADEMLKQSVSDL